MLSVFVSCHITEEEEKTGANFHITFTCTLIHTDLSHAVKHHPNHTGGRKDDRNVSQCTAYDDSCFGGYDKTLSCWHCCSG